MTGGRAVEKSLFMVPGEPAHPTNARLVTLDQWANRPSWTFCLPRFYRGIVWKISSFRTSLLLWINYSRSKAFS